MLEFLFLGGFKVTFNGANLSGLNGLRSQWLLARLLLNQQSSILRSELAWALWPESTPEQARTNLRRELHKLRGSHPQIADAICLEGQVIRWEMPPAGRLDVHELISAIEKVGTAQASDCPELAASILKLDRGDLLPLLTDDWIHAERESVTRLLSDGLLALAKRLEAMGKFRLVIDLANRLLRHDRLNEAAYHLLMLGHISLDDRTRAIRTYHTCRETLRDELSIEPGHQIQELFDRFSQQAIGNRRDQGQISRQLRQGTNDPVALVGQQPVLEQLVRIWERVASNGAHLVSIEGEAGIGKTRLAYELVNIVASSGAISADTRAYAAEGVLPFSCIRRWLEAPSISGVLDHISAVSQAELTQIFPGLLNVGSTDKRKPTEQTKLERQRLFHALAEPLQLLSSPTVLLIDDLQWCDEDTTQWLSFLMRQIADKPVLILSTMRSAEIGDGHAQRSMLQSLLSSNQLTQIQIERLEPREIAALVTQVYKGSDRSPEADHIYQLCGGNPFFTIEYLKAWQSMDPSSKHSVGVPQRVDNVIRHRMAAISEPANEVANLASVVGRQFSESIIERVGLLPSDDVANAIDELWRCQIINEAGDGQYVFAHDCLRESIYAAMGPAQRRLRHRQVAAALLAGKNHYGVSGELAHHCQQGGELDQAAHWFQHASQAARRQLAFKEAIRFARLGVATLNALEKSQDSVQIPDEKLQFVLTEIASVKALGEVSISPLQRLSESIEHLLPKVIDTKLRFAAIETLRHLSGQSDVEKALELSRELIRIADSGLRAEFTVSARRSHGFTQFQLGRFHDSIDTLRIARQKIEEGFKSGELDRSRPLHHVHIVLGLLAYLLELTGKLDDANEVLASLHSLPIEHLPVVGQGFVRHFLTKNPILRCDREPVYKHLAWMKLINEKNEVGITKLLEAEFSAWLANEEGSTQKAIKTQLRVLRIVESGHHGMYQPMRLARLAEMYLNADDATSALERIEEGLNCAEQIVHPFWNAELYRLKALGLAQAGSCANEVEQTFDLSLETSTYQGALALALRCIASKVRYLIDSHRLKEAQQLLGQSIADYRAQSELADYAALEKLGREANLKVERSS